MKKYHKFYEMDIWKEGFELQKSILNFSLKFPKHERYSLTNQINRSSNSVIANIAKAHGRFNFKDKIRVLYIVRGEIQETQNHLIVAKSRGYIQEEELENVINKYERLKMGVNKMISNFRKK